MLAGDEFWTQGFSEPNAGSDLASLKTRAERVGDDYVVNGQKIWTSDASMAEWGFFLVRTDADVKPQRGISFLLIRMDTPGLTVRPIVSIEGGLGLNEVFLDNVRVPCENLVGEAGHGLDLCQVPARQGAHRERLPLLQQARAREGARDRQRCSA